MVRRRERGTEGHVGHNSAVLGAPRDIGFSGLPRLYSPRTHQRRATALSLSPHKATSGCERERCQQVSYSRAVTNFYEEASAAFRSGDNEYTRQLSERALDAARAAGDAEGEVDALCFLGRVALREGDVTRVRSLADEARSVARLTGEARLEQMPLHMQAVAARTEADYSLARRLYEESIELNRALGEERMATGELHHLADVELHDGQPDRAKELFAAALSESRRLGFDALLPYLVGDAAVVAAEEGETERAARLAAAAQAAFRARGQVPDPDDAAEQERLRAHLVSALGEKRFRAASEQGAMLTIADALGDSM